MNLGKLTNASLYAGDETCGTSLESYRAGIIALSLIVIIQTALLVGLLVKILFLAKRSKTHTYSHCRMLYCTTHNVQDLRRR